jgi:hypothetical protein
MKESDVFGEPEVPDYYVDSIRIAVGLYTFALELGLAGLADQPGSRPPSKPLAVVRMSPQHAMVLAKLLRKNLDQYQARVGKINLPDQLYADMSIPKED